MTNIYHDPSVSGGAETGALAADLVRLQSMLPSGTIVRAIDGGWFVQAPTHSAGTVMPTMAQAIESEFSCPNHWGDWQAIATAAREIVATAAAPAPLSAAPLPAAEPSPTALETLRELRAAVDGVTFWHDEDCPAFSCDPDEGMDDDVCECDLEARRYQISMLITDATAAVRALAPAPAAAAASGAAPLAAETREDADARTLLLSFFRQLALCDHMGDVGNEADTVLRILGIDANWRDFSELAHKLEALGVPKLCELYDQWKADRNGK